MKARNAISLLLVAVTALYAAIGCTESNYYAISGYAQGGQYLVKLNTAGASADVRQMKDSIDSILRAVDRSVSGYNRESLLSRFNAGETIVPDSIFIDLYRRSRAMWEASGGVLDVAAAPLFDIWGFGFTSDSLPSQELVSRTLAQCGMARLAPRMEDCIAPGGILAPASLLSWDAPAPEAQTALSPSAKAGHLEISEVQPTLPKLNYNAVAQGYSVDLVAAYLRSVGVRDMLINVGGEIFSAGVNQDGAPWTIGIDRPEDGNNVGGEKIEATFKVPAEPRGVVTSGNYRKFYVRDGRKYSHTIDPRTGCPVEHSLLSSTVIAEDGFIADALATCCMVLGKDCAAQMILERPDTEACLIYEEDSQMKLWTSPGFPL